MGQPGVEQCGRQAGGELGRDGRRAAAAVVKLAAGEAETRAGVGPMEQASDDGVGKRGGGDGRACLVVKSGTALWRRVREKLGSAKFPGARVLSDG